MTEKSFLRANDEIYGRIKETSPQVTMNLQLPKNLSRSSVAMLLLAASLHIGPASAGSGSKEDGYRGFNDVTSMPSARSDIMT